MDRRTEVILDGLHFPEGPRWHDDKLWFSDMHGHRVMTVDLEGNAEAVVEAQAVHSHVYRIACRTRPDLAGR